MAFSESILVALFCMLVVFGVLAILYVLILAFSKILQSLVGNRTDASKQK